MNDINSPNYKSVVPENTALYKTDIPSVILVGNFISSQPRRIGQVTGVSCIDGVSPGSNGAAAFAGGLIGAFIGG